MTKALDSSFSVSGRRHTRPGKLRHGVFRLIALRGGAVVNQFAHPTFMPDPGAKMKRRNRKRSGRHAVVGALGYLLDQFGAERLQVFGRAAGNEALVRYHFGIDKDRARVLDICADRRE